MNAQIFPQPKPNHLPQVVGLLILGVLCGLLLAGLMLSHSSSPAPSVGVPAAAASEETPTTIPADVVAPTTASAPSSAPTANAPEAAPAAPAAPETATPAPTTPKRLQEPTPVAPGVAPK